jgi:hypothetical protein
MLFMGATPAASLMAMLAGANVNADVFAYGRDTAQGLFPSTPWGWRRCSRSPSVASGSGPRPYRLGFPPRIPAGSGSSDCGRRPAVDPTRLSKLSLLVSVVILFVRQPSPASAIKVDHDADT